MGNRQNLNTSHVILYRNKPFNFKEDAEYLNTSHVILYHTIHAILFLFYLI